MKKLTPAMEKALGLATPTLYRWPGGFWCPVEWSKARSHEVGIGRAPTPYAGTQTVRALVDRGLLVFEDWKTATRAPEPQDEVQE